MSIPFTEVSYRKRKAQVTTFYVTNLPGGVSQSLLWKAFQPYGVMKDAYVVWKRDSRGNYFGFVRYIGVDDINSTLHGMNTVKIYEAKLSVSLAKFDKKHKKFNYNVTTGMERMANHAPQPRLATVNKADTIHRQDRTTVGCSYRDIVAGYPDGETKNPKVVVARERITTYPDHCMIRSVIVEVKDVLGLQELRTLLDFGGYTENPVCYLGGLMCMVVFKEKRLALEFIDKEAQPWSNVIVNAVLWKGQELQYNKLTWIKVEGVPVHLRDNNLYDRIREQFGRLVGPSDFSWESSDNSCGSCWILTSGWRRIEEEITVTWYEHRYKVWVSEEYDPRLRTIINELLLDV